MRLHSLHITAFGPFADTVEVDFDALSDTGLFLLSGPTGAGKSSVLDAVCFALYGDVPGDRSAAGRLRCDQAADGVAPRVRMEMTLKGRRFRIERSPRWERPKKRGTGLTTQQPSVALLERIDDTWQPLSTRLDETGHLMTDLVGLTLPQFCQVALLPQGRFQAFLRARSEDRHALLRQVFRTGRFDRIEQWLRDRRLELQRSSTTHGRGVADLVGRVSEATGSAVPVDWDVADLSLEAADGTVAGWVSDHLDATTTDLALADAERTQCDLLVASATAGLAAGRALDDRQAAHAAATARLADHDETELSERSERLRRAERAEALADLDVAVEEDASLVARLTQQAQAAIAAWKRVGDTDETAPTETDAGETDLSAALAAARRALDVVDAAQPDAERLHEITRTTTDVAARLTEAAAEADRLGAELETTPLLLHAAEESLAAAQSAAELVASRESALSTAREQARAARELVTVSPALAAAREERELARERVARLKETWLEVREARLDGMAAEIAGALAVGASCPVCGSHDHPHLAVAGDGSPDAAGERAARKDVDDAEGLLVVLDDRLRQVEAQHTRLLTVSDGRSADEAAQVLDEAAREHERVAALARAVPGLTQDVARLRSAGDELQRGRDEAAQRRTDLEARLELHRAESERLRARLDDVLAGSGCSSVGALRRLRQRQLDALDEACVAHDRVTMARRDLARAQRALSDAATGAGFGSVEEARGARMTAGERQSLADEIVRLEDVLRAARAVVDDPDHCAAAALPRPDLTALAAAHTASESAARTAHARHDEATRRRSRLTTLADEVTEALQAWRPVRDELELTARLALLVEGRSADNALQMRLSAYVLTHRLSQVVAAANERLARMSDQRYSLEHTGRRGAGETRGGLSLLVRDDWSGESRDPATLSGGETFVVSLALALGLADVITQEAGGADLDTLFVDEGFGSLDADTLDDVMDTLDGLRDGGRVVGVVSHVAEMQTRIPSQLRVTKGRDGSRVALAVG
ncbi:AAA family ATPase [Nocardioides currus]|uniref:Nuclease SbcCD subunit C n=1 Tax=Nocardioides currus TaxID=2133958 RepID=A0A2R7YS73_9ACTN|nr:SMC family ATPase [Nocardioides currus]PUA79265.1 SMC family ATPase [Nocardioides currus]